MSNDGQSGASCLHWKIFNDPIHGHIDLHPLLVKIIDTPQFQRLRNIKQLGGVYHVFPGACHNRFEHSIGVAHLAGELVETLEKRQPELEISKEDILCVKIAGLCHDLGHGPYSHMFDKSFIPMVKPGDKWKHEQASVMMFDHLLKVNKINYTEYNLNEDDILFIKEQIAGPKNRAEYKGRCSSKTFLYEIVANKRNSIDVDKWDYFARDCYFLGIANNFNLRRYMKFARVIKVEEEWQICTREKEIENLYEMFHTRISLHRQAYQHKTVKIVEHMITEALIKANDFILIPGEKEGVKMSEAIKDPYAYTHLTDFVFQQIMMSTDERLNESKQILQRLESRQLYKFIGTHQIDEEVKEVMDPAKIVKEIVDMQDPESKVLKEEDLVVEIIIYNYGMGSEDPIRHMRFYAKENPDIAVEIQRHQVSKLLPDKFLERKILFYYKKSDKEGVDAAKKFFFKKYENDEEVCGTPKKKNPPLASPYISPLDKGKTGEKRHNSGHSDEPSAKRRLN